MGRRADVDRCSCGLVLDGPLGQAYNEEAFKYLLGLHRRRSQRSERPFVLVLVELKEHSTSQTRIEHGIARRLFSGLCTALRDSDVIGWYQDGYIAGALLTDVARGTWPHISGVITQRVESTLAAAVPSSITERLQVRVCQIQPKLLTS